MAGPWEAFQDQPQQAASAGPWEAYSKPQRSAWDKLTGADGGERYQLWPERLARGVAKSVYSGVTFPGDVMAGKDSPDNMARVMDLATIALPVSPAAKAVKLPFEKPTEVPTARELAEAGGKQFEQFRKSGVEYSADSVADWSRRAQQRLFDDGIGPVDAPATFEKLKALENAPPGAFITPANLHSLRRSLQATAQSFNPQASRDRLAASRGIAELDSYIASPPASGVVAGTPSAASVPFEAGRGNYAAAQRANDLTGELDRARTGLLERAEGRAQAANSGRNFDNTLRQKAEGILEKPKEISGFSDAELAALDRVVQGGAGRNTARYIGNLLGGGGGFGQAFMAGLGAAPGAMTGNPILAVVGAGAPMAIGSSAKAVANALAKRDLRAVDELMRKRSPLYEERLANPELKTLSPEKRAAVARAMMLDAFDNQ